MGELLSGWISIGDQMFERVELYENRLDKTFERFVPATYGGPILVSHGNLMSVCAASGSLLFTFPFEKSAVINMYPQVLKYPTGNGGQPAKSSQLDGAENKNWFLSWKTVTF